MGLESELQESELINVIQDRIENLPPRLRRVAEVSTIELVQSSASWPCSDLQRPPNRRVPSGAFEVYAHRLTKRLRSASWVKAPSISH